MNKTLYNSKFEHDACGIGAIIDLDGKPNFSIVDDALTIVEKLEHRAGKDATGEIGDGVGIMVQVPHDFFSKVGKEMGINLGNRRDYGVGMFFFPQDVLSRLQSQKMFEIICAKEGVEFLGWRNVPVNTNVMSKKAQASTPFTCQHSINVTTDSVNFTVMQTL